MSTLKGIDISYWQGNVDFAKVKSAVDFIIFREGYGTTIDSKFLEYVKGAKSSGIPIHGIYHFCYSLNESDVIKEAESCLKNVKNAGLGKDTIIFFDFEYDTVTKAKSKGVNLGKTQCTNFTVKFCEYVESQGYKAGVYYNLDYRKNMYDMSKIDKYVHWLAQYNNGFAPSYDCAYHQYSSSGKINGISGNVDMNYCYKVISNSSTTNTTTKEETKMGNYDKYLNSNSTHYISNSGSDERGAYHGGSAGDQTGNEWCLRSWYNRPWNCVLRHPNEAVRLKIAELACAAALNNNIGYDQYQRDTYWNQLKANGYNPAKINVACEADCSAGVCANVKAVGYLLGIDALKNLSATYTGNMRTGFKNAGFTVLTDSKYLNGYSYLLPGDILLNDGAHTATNITKGANAVSTSSAATSTTSSVSKTVTKPQSGSIFNKTCKFVGVVTADELNIRKGAGTDWEKCSFSPLKEKTEVEVCDTCSNGWYYIKYNGKYGFCSNQYIKKKEDTSSTSAAPTTTTSGGLNRTPKWVGSVTADVLNVRTWAGTENPTCSFSPLRRGVVVDVCDSVKAKDGSLWYYIGYNNKYGFVHSNYIKK